MGVIYKLHPQVRNFILNSKKDDPSLSCRGISALISNKFQLKLSKSRVNFVIKQAGLSMPVGRRRKLKKNLIEAEGLGALLLKSADYMIGGTDLLVRILNDHAGIQIADQKQQIEYQLYGHIFDLSEKTKFFSYDSGLWALTEKRLTEEEIRLYHKQLQYVKLDYAKMYDIIQSLFSEIRTIRLDLSNNSSFFIDGQQHTVWSNPQVPNDFSLSLYKSNNYVETSLKNDDPIVLLNAPGYNTPSKEFFNFLSCSKRMENRVVKAVLYNNILEESNVINFEPGKKLNYVFGLWPWQYGKYRNVKITGQFKHFNFEPQNANYYVAEAEVELSQDITNNSITLRGCALKTGVDEKIKLIILTNLSDEQADQSKLLDIYLNKWPNLEEGFHDFSKKIELSTYSSILLPPVEIDPGNDLDNVQNDISMLLEYYLKLLDRYVRIHFFPPYFAKKDLQAMSGLFYGIKGRIKLKKTHIEAAFLVPASHPYLKAFDYACRRLNEYGISLFNNKKLWFKAEIV